MRYKVGDQVKVKSIDWYNYNKDGKGSVNCGKQKFVELMSAYCGRTLTIKRVVNGKFYRMVEVSFFWTDDMFEGFANNEEQDYILHIEKDWDKEQEIQITDVYEFQDETGNVIDARKVKIVKKKPKYPATYEECCKLLNIPILNMDVLDNMLDSTDMCYRKSLDRKLGALRKLLICRDAYWKIAGDWKPDFGKNSDNYNLIVYEGDVIKDINCGVNHVLTFPTEEMRDTFYENFKDLIEQCKELL